MAQMLVADMKELFAVRSARALERLVDAPTFRKDKEGATHYPGRWRRIERGLHLPDEDRIARAVALQPNAARVRDLPLWEVLNDPPPDDQWLRAFLLALSPEMKRYIFKPRTIETPEPQQRLVWREGVVLNALERVSNLDAFTALLVLYRQAEARKATRYYLGGPVMEVFLRLASFPPFYQVRHALYYYLLEWFLFSDDPEVRPRPQYITNLDAYILGARRLIKMFGRLGLLDHRFAQQLKMISALDRHMDRWIWSMYLLAYEVDKKYLVQPSDRLWKFLHKIRHPCTRSGNPVVLPLKGRRIENVQIANALETSPSCGER